MKNVIENAKKYIKQIIATHMARKTLSDSIIEAERKPALMNAIKESMKSKNEKPYIPKYETLQQIVDQLEWCNYECEAGFLKMNTAFIALKQMAIEDEKEEPLHEMSRAELQLNIMRNIEREIMTMHPRSSLAYWWKHTVNWHKVQTFINCNTRKMGSTSSAVQCRFIGADPDSKTFLKTETEATK
jgi:hypothetical protein